MSAPAGIKFTTAADMPEDYGRWMIHGPQGSGKTTLAATIAEAGPTLFLDFVGEKGIRSFRGSPWEKNITVARPETITDLDDLFWWLNKGEHEFVAVVVDSLTAVQKMTMRFLLGHSETAVREIKQGTAPADQRTWGQSLDVMQDTATFWYGLADGNRKRPMHVVMTAQSRALEDDQGNVLSQAIDVQKGARSITLASPDYILYTYEEEDYDNPDADGRPAVRNTVKFGAHPGFSTKGRLPYHLRGKVPSVLGRKSPTSLASLSRVLGIGGIPAATKAAPAAKPAASAAPVKEKK